MISSSLRAHSYYFSPCVCSYNAIGKMKLSIAILLITVELTITLARDIGSVIDISTAKTTTPAENTLNLPCKTGKAAPGTCVKREACDYATSAIDFTLYEPKGFKRICSSGEVCCPQDSLVQHEDSENLVPDKNKFDFDDDD